MLCVFSVELLISCRLYTGCCAHVAGNPWRCDCDSMYTVYRTFRNGTGQHVTLQCDSPADLRGKSWDVLEGWCQLTVTAPQPAVTGRTANTTAVSTANTTAVSTSQPAQFNTTVQHNVSVQESSPDWSSPSPFHPPSISLVIFLVIFAVIVFIAVLVVNIAVSRLRRSTRQLNRLWWEDVVARKELMSD